MNAETKQCQNCRQNFVIEPEDFDFYKMMAVPPPTFCPDCRLQRRLSFRNERLLYKRECDNCKKSIISNYSPENATVVYCRECWWSDIWNPLSLGFEYDFSENFFVQFKNLLKKVPIQNLFNAQPINSEYCNFTAENKNCYLIFGGRENENIAYTHNASNSKDSFDLSVCLKLELCYEDLQCENSNKLFFSRNSDNCSESYFLYECKNCANCFGCTNLRNKQFCIFNTQFTKEEYEAKLKEFDLGSYSSILELKKKAHDVYLREIHKFSHLINTVNCTGNNIRNAKNCHHCFDISGNDSENTKYTTYAVVGVKDSYDNYGMPKAERIYETIAVGFESNENSDYKFSFFIKASSNISYSINCIGSHDLFACIGLRNKSYCILNKQYTKEEYEALVPKIIEHMDTMPYIDQKERVYKYGEFFPTELSPFAYNETIAQEYFPLTKEEVLGRGFQWKDPNIKDYKITKRPENLPDNIKDVDDLITDDIIECSHFGSSINGCNHQCTTAFRILPNELKFYRQTNLPLPRLCPNCRHHERLAQRNPFKLWHRSCQCAGLKSENGAHENVGQHKHGLEKCSNKFETSYSPERKEIIYCEQCYQAEVV